MNDREAELLSRLLHECAPLAPVHGDTASRARARARLIRRNRRAGLAGVLAVSLVAVGVPVALHLAPEDGPDSRVAGPGPITNCPVTEPVPDSQVPAGLRDLGDRWVGADDLWIEPPPGAASPGTTRLKYGTFTLDKQGRMSDAGGTPTLTAHRLDGEGTAQGDEPHYSSASGPRDQVIHFWPTTITLPQAGCWQLTARLKDTTVAFVVDVGREQPRTPQALVPALALPPRASDRLPPALRKDGRGLDTASSRLLGRSRYGEHWVALDDHDKICLVTRLAAKHGHASRAAGVSGSSCTTPQIFRRRGLLLTVDGDSDRGAAAYLLPADVDKSSVQAAARRLNQIPDAKAAVVQRGSTLALVYSLAASPDQDTTIARTGDQPGPALHVPNP